jgi:methylase of polypeptide subunit release factors
MLPISLREVIAENRYVLLNGNAGNFCLDFVGNYSQMERRAAAWSCDVGHFVTIHSDQIVVDRWDRGGAEERYSLASVLSKIHDFQRHLERSSIDRSRDIVNHAVRVFRRIRTMTAEDTTGERSLNLFLYLLATSAIGAPGTSAIGEVGLSSEVADDFRSLPRASVDSLYSDLLGEGRYDVLKPDIALTLRHASGSIFQEAHRQASVPPNMYLPGLEIAASMTQGLASDSGVYFTPQALARALAEEAVSNVLDGQSRESLRVFDPACGSGELLKEVLRQLERRKFSGKIEIIGWDRSSISVQMARFTLSWEIRSWKSEQVSISIEERDSTEAETWPTKVDVVVMNPPFRSWQQMTPRAQEVTTERLGILMRNKPNLASVFAVRALDSLSQDSSIAMIAPKSLFEGDSAAKVRAAISEKVNPILYARLGDQNIFADAFVDAGLFVATTKREKTDIAILWADSQPSSSTKALRGLRRWRGAESTPLAENGFSVYSRPDSQKPGTPWLARSFDSWMSYENIRRSRRVVEAAACFDIHQGARLGSDCFIVTSEYFKGLSGREKAYFRPAVMNASIAAGRLRPEYYAFFPYTEGLRKIDTEEELREAVPQYYADVLLPSKRALAARKSLAKLQDPHWWDLLWPRSWQQARKPHLVSKYFGDTRSFAFDESGEYVVVVGHGWLPLDKIWRHAASSRDISLAMLCYLQSKIAQSLLGYVSIQVSGGQWDLSSKYLKKLLIPDFTKIDPSSLSLMRDVGERISLDERSASPEFFTDKIVLQVIHGG